MLIKRTAMALLAIIISWLTKVSKPSSIILLPSKSKTCLQPTQIIFFNKKNDGSKRPQIVHHRKTCCWRPKLPIRLQLACLQSMDRGLCSILRNYWSNAIEICEVQEQTASIDNRLIAQHAPKTLFFSNKKIGKGCQTKIRNKIGTERDPSIRLIRF